MKGEPIRPIKQEGLSLWQLKGITFFLSSFYWYV